MSARADLPAALTADHAHQALEHATALAEDSWSLAVHLEETNDTSLLAEMVEAIQQTKDRLNQAEADLASILADWAKTMAAAARMNGDEDTSWPFGGTVREGFRWELHRRKDRKEWDHEDWKRDVRLKVTHDALAGLPADATLQHVNLETGEVVEVTLSLVLLDAITKAQAVHGSAAPKTTVLKPMGLDVDDYCTTLRGAWTVSIIPDADAGITTEEDTTS